MLGYSLQFWESILIFAGYSTIISLGQYVSMSSGFLSVAHAALAGAGGYAAAIASINFGLPLAAGVLCGTVAGFLLGLLIGFLSVRLAPAVAGLSTLAFAEATVVIALNSEALGGVNGLIGVPLLTSLPLVVVVLLALTLFVWRFDSSRLGLAARACRDDLQAARAMGIDATWVKTITFALGGALAGVGGVIAVYYTGVQQPNGLGFWNGVNYSLFVVFGGSYVVWGPILGTVSLVLLPELLRFSVAERFVMYGLLLAMTMIAFPNGLVRRRPMGYVRPAATRRVSWRDILGRSRK